MKKIFYLIVVLTGLTSISCDDQLAIDLPGNVLPEEQAIKTEADLQELLNSSYDVMANFYNGRMQNLSELLSDNLSSDFSDGTGFFREVYNRSANFFNSEVGSFYSQPWFAIHRANLLIGALTTGKFSDLPDPGRSRMIAEAKFIRAVCHFELGRLFAQPYGYTDDNSHPGIPLRVQSSPYPEPRSTVDAVYTQILADLTEAAETLPEQNGNYATSHAANGFLAKVYFQMNDYANAANHASLVIESGDFELAPDVMDRFQLEVSSEAVFSTVSTRDATAGINDVRSGEFTGKYRSDRNIPFLKVSKNFYLIATADPEDNRKDWYTLTNEGLPGEFVAMNRYNTDVFSVAVVHLPELMLIRAESLAELNQSLPTAIEDINDIRRRAGITTNLVPVNAAAAQIIEAARAERRLELVTEGNRVQDLKRIGASGEEVGIRNAPWDCDGLVLPFPAAEEVPGFVNNPTGGCN